MIPQWEDHVGKDMIVLQLVQKSGILDQPEIGKQIRLDRTNLTSFVNSPVTMSKWDYQFEAIFETIYADESTQIG